MKKRKVEHDFSRQSKIPTFFCRTLDSVSRKESTHVENSKLCGNDTINVNEKGENSMCFVEKGSIATNNDAMERTSLKCAKLNICIGDAAIDKPMKSFIRSSATVGIEELGASSIVMSPESLSEKGTVVDSMSGTLCSSNKLVCECSGGLIGTEKDVGVGNTSIRSFAHLAPGESCSNSFHRSDTDGGLGSSELVPSRESVMISSIVCNVNPTSHSIHVLGENDTKLRLTEDCAISEALLSVKHEVKCGNFEEEIIDISLEEWDLGVSDQHDDKVYNLQLNAMERCQVISISSGPVENSKLLVVTSTSNKDMAKVLLQGVWASACRVSAGDVVSIQCCGRDEDAGWWVLDDNSALHQPTDGGLLSKLGLLVENPDVLMPGTSVVGSLFCTRKGVLSDRFRGFEMAAIPPPLVALPHDPSSPDCQQAVTGQPSAARVMLVGSLVHEVLQKCLIEGLCKAFEIGRACHEVVSGQKAVWDIYAAGAELSEVRKEVMEFVPRIARFMGRFVGRVGGVGGWGVGRENVDARSEWQGCVAEVRDIEECLWVPPLGLKGKVDVTVAVHQQGAPFLKEMPLEVKTGKGSYSAEHQGQVLLYCAMMSALGTAHSPTQQNVSSGLLLYLREESMREVHASRHAVRDLILLRNDLVHHLTRGPGIVEHNREEGNASVSFSLPVLPEPIKHKRACSSCPYLTICSAHLKCDNGLEGIPSDHPMSSLAPQALNHLSAAHLNYFVRWSCLVALEHEDCVQSSRDHSLWTMEPWEREKIGKCICNLHAKEVGRAVDEASLGRRLSTEGFVHRFVRAADEESGCMALLPSSTFSEGERVLVGWGHRIAVSSGTVISSDEDELCICMDRDLKQRYGNGRFRFHVDKYKYASTASSFSLTALALLLSDTWSANRLRELIIDCKSPNFLKKLSGGVLAKCSSILRGLNKRQVRAVLSALAAQDFLLVRGLPGTGKSATIVAMVRAFVCEGRSVLVTGHTHSSVDNVLSRLVALGDLGPERLVRLGPSSQMMHSASLLPYCESTLVANCQTPKEVEKAFLSKAVVGATCMACGTHPLLSSRAFDVCILDEAGQVLLPITLRPILSSKVFVLVGDSEQLPPVVRSHRARSLGLEQTLFSTLYSPEACVTLNLQYRMNSAITQLANDLSYGSRLICANEQVANSVIHLPRPADLANAYPEDPWLLEVLSSELERSVVFLDTGGTLHLSKEDFYPRLSEAESSCSEETLHQYTNVCEASLTFYLVSALLKGGIKVQEIGVMAPYTDQVTLLRRALSGVALGGEAVDVNTVDQFQGRDKEIIIYSFTRSGDVLEAESSKTKDLQLLSNKHRLTVAVTRAKQKLICIGHMELLMTYAVLRNFISLLPESNTIDLCRDGNGFSWARVLKSLSM